MIFFHFLALYCSILTLEDLNVSRKGPYKDTLLFQTIKDVLDEKHEFINRNFLLHLFTKEADKDEIDEIFKTLSIVYDIVSDKEKAIILDTMHDNFEEYTSYKKHNVKTLFLSKLISRLTDISCNYDVIFRNPKYKKANIILILKLTSGYKKYLKTDSISKASEFLNDLSNPIVRKLIECDSFVDKFLILEIIYISLFRKEIDENLRNNFYDCTPYYELLSRMHQIFNPKKSSMFLFFFGKGYKNEEISQVSVSTKFPTSENLLSIFKGFSFEKKNSGNISPSNLVDDFANKAIYFDNEYTDLLLSQLHLFSVLHETEILIKMTKIGENKNSIEIQKIEDNFHLNLKLRSLKERHDSTKEMEKLIKRNIIEGKLHGFTTVVNIKSYTFKKPSPGSVGTLSICLRLSCGHFIGKELLAEYFYMLNHKCHLCRQDATVANYFETIVYEEEDSQ
jgi:hypothetical protein